MSDKLVFWSFQHRLLELDDKADATDRILCLFTADNGTLTIGDTYVPTYGADSIVSDASILARYGMTHLHQTFKYSVKNGKMTLTGDDVRLHLRQF